MNVSPLTQRVITGLALLAVFLVLLFYLSPLFWMLAMMLVLLLAADELGRLLGSDGFARYGLSASPHYRWLLPLGLTAAAISFFFFLGRHSEAEQMIFLIACYALLTLLVLTVLPWWLVRFEKDRLQGGRLTRAGFALVGGWLLFCSWLAIAQLRSVSPWLLLAVLVLMWLADSAAYFAGRAFGKHKLAPKTSPGKTWEGAVGALLAVTVYALALAPFMLPKASALWALPVAAQWLIWLGLAWLLTVLSVFGDLFESLIKRMADRKDSGALLPGHGGILDRIDSLLTTVPVAALMVSLLV
ncbi:MAG: phosphatidate cytidylyltransferase [Proteobacteria bacterium]|nr:phosphatidate cytidylyltransferase [Pseudomonadota bacterium]MCL2307626.1 phosphatidate cytidylyltransferase [Pseudomonadota bacterium]